MKSFFKIFIIIAIGMTAIVGCNYFEDPTIDKNGEKIPLIIISNPTFDTKVVINIYDLEENRIENTTVRFAIKGGDGLINLSGKKNSSNIYTTSAGIFELYLDPAILPDQSPITLTFEDVTTNSQYHILPYQYKISSEGVHNIILHAINVNPNTTKSASVAKEASTRLFDVLDSKGAVIQPLYDLNFAQTGSDYLYVACYAGVSGEVTCSPLNDIKYSSYGIFKDYTTPIVPLNKLTVSSKDIFYTVVKYAQTEFVDKMYLQVAPTFTDSSFTTSIINYTLSIPSSGEVITRGIIQGIIPFTATIGNFSVPSGTNIEAKLSFSKESPFVSKESVIISAPISNKTASFNVSKENKDLVAYNLDIKLYDPKNPYYIIAPTKSFQYKLPDATEWGTFELKDGKATLLLSNKKLDYLFRTEWDGKWFATGKVPTDPASISDFLKKQESSNEDIVINKMTITEDTITKSVTIAIEMTTSFASNLL